MLKQVKSSRIQLVVVFFLALLGRDFGQGPLTNVGTTAAPFLEVGVGAEAIGMGGAYVALARDVTGLYWNPGGISRVQQPQGLFERTTWLADIGFNFFGVVVPLPQRGVLGFFINAMSVPYSPVRTVGYPQGTGEEFDATSFATGLSYGMNLTDRFSIGFNLKYIQERIWHEKASSFGLDVGTLYDTGLEGLTLGAAITNFGPSLQLSGSDLIIYEDVDPTIDGNNDRIMGTFMTDKWPLPLNMQFGIAYDLLDSKTSRITWALDALHPINNTESINTGVEINLMHILTARVGYKALFQQDTEEGLTLGAGLRYKLFGQSTILVDFAFADFGRMGNVNRYSVRMNF
ncbi:MAG: PorV/PorQ family protein [Candidatus Marinimicrobia bacterium]|nr:PorV/PorQ family protein [Candidatus Neomarinimicrobiota bacterium]MCF7841178.1 PorV/PorQ family protein [Candidatus Neomarinimicrobiota bacterium]MCF7902443.1 PorV/PorQ family protein [Candidatus Neomarinimicrobiota bacterium]